MWHVLHLCYIVWRMVHPMAKGKQIADRTEAARQLTLRWGCHPGYLGGFNVITSVLKCVPASAVRALQTGFSVLLTSPPSFWGHFLTFWYHKMFQAHLVHLLTLPFLQGTPVPFVKERCLEAKMHTERQM